MREKDPRVQAEKLRVLERDGIISRKDLDNFQMTFGTPTRPQQTQTPISTFNSVFTPPPKPDLSTKPPQITDIGVKPLESLDYGENEIFKKEQEILDRCKELRRAGINSRFCRNFICKRNPFLKSCR